jgi:hypothetical protein
MITLEEFVARARDLRAKVDVAEREFLDYLVWGETQTFWQDTGYVSYLELLKHLSLVDAARYDAYKKMTEAHGAAAAKVSVTALRAAARFTSKEAQRELIDQATAFEDVNEVPISERTAQKYAGDIRERMAAISSRNKSYASVVAELETAKREIGRLKIENQNLRTENQNLRSAVSSQKTRGAKTKKARRAA